MEAAKAKDEEHYRDELSNVDKKGKRLWIFPKKPKGGYYKARSIVAWALMALMFAGPFLKWHGHPLLLFNVLERKFILFGFPFWPQDFKIFAVATLVGIVFIVLFTVVWGRVFCGWVCPQTIFMEMLFRKIEYWIDGDWKQQQKLQAMPWNGEKIRKRTLKHTLFFILSFVISNTFLAYIIGIDELSLLVTDGPLNHLGSFFALIMFTGVFYFVFAWFRELVCIIVCPYGRLQGVMLDKKSVVVTYDHVRGEPRGKINKKEAQENLGDCIDCNLCVNVCPTGIDIRNGVQLECINCTACIDACDEVMVKIDRPKSLIRYDTVEGVEKGEKWKLSGRSIAYSSVLVLLIAVLTFFIVTRDDVESIIVRTYGTTYEYQGKDKISNLYNVEFLNKTFKNKEITLKLENNDHDEIELVIIGGQQFVAPPGEQSKGTIMIIIPLDEIESNRFTVPIGVYVDGDKIETFEAGFVAPVID
ncbi:MAG TPA: cytochrome c oxidase accessory protein CcoG [Bacteroidetes bacterium]|nr:cytochrome c oxidase accessory protein CcoG [Bacteroidota bacterium]